MRTYTKATGAHLVAGMVALLTITDAIHAVAADNWPAPTDVRADGGGTLVQLPRVRINVTIPPDSLQVRDPRMIIRVSEPMVITISDPRIIITISDPKLRVTITDPTIIQRIMVTDPR